jgi:hypothetical protein
MPLNEQPAIKSGITVADVLAIFPGAKVIARPSKDERPGETSSHTLSRNIGPDD